MTILRKKKNQVYLSLETTKNGQDACIIESFVIHEP